MPCQPVRALTPAFSTLIRRMLSPQQAAVERSPLFTRIRPTNSVCWKMSLRSPELERWPLIQKRIPCFSSPPGMVMARRIVTSCPARSLCLSSASDSRTKSIFPGFQISFRLVEYNLRVLSQSPDQKGGTLMDQRMKGKTETPGDEVREVVNQESPRTLTDEEVVTERRVVRRS